MTDAHAFRDSLPRKRMAAGAVIRDEIGRVLLVDPVYKDTWEVPGGAVEQDESPRAGCARELREELGLDVPVGRLLVFEWQGPEQDRNESCMLLFDGGILTAGSTIELPADELRAWAFVEPEELDDLLVPRLSRRVRAALTALEQDRLVELEWGIAVPSSP